MLFNCGVAFLHMFPGYVIVLTYFASWFMTIFLPLASFTIRADKRMAHKNAPALIILYTRITSRRALQTKPSLYISTITALELCDTLRSTILIPYIMIWVKAAGETSSTKNLSLCIYKAYIL